MLNFNKAIGKIKKLILIFLRVFYFCRIFANDIANTFKFLLFCALVLIYAVYNPPSKKASKHYCASIGNVFRLTNKSINAVYQKLFAIK